MIAPFKQVPGPWMLAVVSLVLLLDGQAHANDSLDRPNVLFIAVDDLNDWVGCLGGHPQAKTQIGRAHV